MDFYIIYGSTVRRNQKCNSFSFSSRRGNDTRAFVPSIHSMLLLLLLFSFDLACLSSSPLFLSPVSVPCHSIMSILNLIFFFEIFNSMDCDGMERSVIETNDDDKQRLIVSCRQSKENRCKLTFSVIHSSLPIDVMPLYCRPEQSSFVSS